MSEKNEYPWSSEELTTWHDGDVKPVYDGVYQRKYNEPTNNIVIGYCKFENGLWYSFDLDINKAINNICESCFQDEIKWRGLAK